LLTCRCRLDHWLEALWECWLGLFEQIFGIAKWNACRV
jgi:hypothetical protein